MMRVKGGCLEPRLYPALGAGGRSYPHSCPFVTRAQFDFTAHYHMHRSYSMKPLLYKRQFVDAKWRRVGSNRGRGTANPTYIHSRVFVAGISKLEIDPVTVWQYIVLFVCVWYMHSVLHCWRLAFHPQHSSLSEVDDHDFGLVSVISVPNNV